MEPNEKPVNMHRLADSEEALAAVPHELKQVYDVARDEVDGFMKDAGAIERDPRLSDLAKREKVTARAQQAFAKLAAHDDVLTGGFEAGATARELQAIEKACGQFDGARANLIVGHFAGLDQMAKLEAVTNAINGNDLETLAALATAPRVLKLLDEKLGARVTAAIFAKVAGPDAVKTVEQTRFSSERTRRAYEDALDEISKRARIAKPVPRWRVGK